jgi:glutamyl-tRNA synthetase
MSNTSQLKTVRTRMAPSPTGEMHIGSLGTILKNYAYARKNQGQFLLRIEDTDKTREVEGAIDRIMETMTQFGIDWDEGPDKDGGFGPYIQSQKIEVYQEMAQRLVDEGKAYYCFCSSERLKEVREKAQQEKRAPKYDRHCLNLSPEEVKAKLDAGESYVIRLRVPDNQEIHFVDLIRGEIVVNSSEVDDQVLLKSDGYPTYHLAAVVDDHQMKISHVMRGEEWLPSTPKHVLLYQAFGWEAPVFAHIPIYLNPNGKGKMSKRKGDVAAQSFLKKGYLPEAVLNLLMILGWTPEDEREILSLDEYVAEFEPTDISKKSVAFDLQKLAWLNGIYIRKLYQEKSLAGFWGDRETPTKDLSLEDRLEEFLPADFPREKLSDILELVYERLERLDEMEELTSFFYRPVEHEENLLLKKATPELVKEQLQELKGVLEGITEWSIPELEKGIRGLQAKHDYKKSQYFMLVRVVMTGRKVSPPLFETMEVIGKDECLQRLEQAMELLG